jgi:serine protease inhibitor
MLWSALIQGITLTFLLLHVNASSYMRLLGRDMTRWENEFAFLFYRNLSIVLPPSRNHNILIAPYALYISLVALYDGAYGYTRSELYETLRLNTHSDLRRNQSMFFINKLFYVNSKSRSQHSTILKMVNAFYLRKSSLIDEIYASNIKGYYHISARNVNFASNSLDVEQKINTWVNERSAGLAKSIIPSLMITPRTVSIVVSTTAFSSPWLFPFLPLETTPLSFAVSWTKSIDVPMVKMVQGLYNYLEDDLVQILELPYEGHEQSMLIILPKSRDIAQINRRLDEGALSRWLKLLEKQVVEVAIIPRFKVRGEYLRYEIDYALKKMGLLEIFHDENANLTGISRGVGVDDKVYVDDIVHKVEVSFDEYGTNYARQGPMNQSLYVVSEQMRENYCYFIATHPFIFIIRDLRFNKILMIGTVFDPSS